MRRRSKELLPVRELNIPNPDHAIEYIDGAIIRAIDLMPGCPALNIIGCVTQEFHGGGIESKPLSHNIIPARLEHLATVGDIVRLRAVNGNRTSEEFTFYPKDYSFETTPRTQFRNSEKKPKGLSGVLEPESQAALDALMTLISMEDPRVRLRILAQFCDRCGELRDGHYCNE